MIHSIHSDRNTPFFAVCPFDVLILIFKKYCSLNVSLTCKRFYQARLYLLSQGLNLALKQPPLLCLSTPNKINVLALSSRYLISDGFRSFKYFMRSTRTEAAENPLEPNFPVHRIVVMNDDFQFLAYTTTYTLHKREQELEVKLHSNRLTHEKSLIAPHGSVVVYEDLTTPSSIKSLCFQSVHQPQSIRSIYVKNVTDIFTFSTGFVVVDASRQTFSRYHLSGAKTLDETVYHCSRLFTKVGVHLIALAYKMGFATLYTECLTPLSECPVSYSSINDNHYKSLEWKGHWIYINDKGVIHIYDIFLQKLRLLQSMRHEKASSIQQAHIAGDYLFLKTDAGTEIWNLALGSFVKKISVKFDLIEGDERQIFTTIGKEIFVYEPAAT